MSLDAGSVYATLGGRFNRSGFVQFDGAMRKSGRSADLFERTLDRSMSRSSRAIHGIGRAATTAAGLGAGGGILALTAAVVGSVKKAADFESQLSSLESVTSANARTMGRFKKQAIEAGAATKYSALEAAQAQTELAKGGLSAAQILGGGLKGALARAAAGELDLADAASYMVNALNLFGLKGKDATHVADALAAAANATTADVSDFGMALSQGGSAAKAAGLSFDETVAALEALASIGIKGSDAGTSLKASLTQLASPTKKAQGVMDDLGLSFFDAHGNMKSVVSISAMLRDKMGGLTKEQRLQAATTLVGTDGMRALLALYESGPGDIKDFEDGLAKQGTAAEVAAKKQDNLKGKIEQLKGSLETAAIVFGSELIPVLQESAEDLTDWVNKAAASGDIKQFGHDFADGLRTAIGYIPEVVDGIQEIGSTAGSVVGTVVDIVNAFGGFDTVAPALLGAAAGLLAFRGLSVVVPVVMQLSTAIGDLFLAARAGGAAFAFETLLTMVNPVTAVAGAFAILGAAIALTAGKESFEEGIARRSAEAKRDQKKAVDELREAESAAANAGLSAQRAEIEHARAVKHLAEVRRDSKSSALDIKDAELHVRETAKSAADSQRNLADATNKRIDAGKKSLDVAQKSANAAKQEVVDAKHRLEGDKDNGHWKLELAQREKEYAAALGNLHVVQNRVSASFVNYLRELQGAPPLHKKNELAVQDLFATYNELPNKVITKLVAEPEEALVKIDTLAARLEGVSNKKTVARILAQGGNSEQIIERLRAKLASLHDKTITITTLDVHKKAGQAAGKGDKATSARGRRTDKGMVSEIGEGAAPEYRFNPDGSGYKTAGPEIAYLDPGTTIVPTESRFRGRGIDLWMQAGHDLGVPGFAGGVHTAGGKKKPPKKRFIPKALDALRLPVDQIEHASDTAKGKYDDQHGKVAGIEADIKSAQSTAGQKATKYNKDERAKAKNRLIKLKPQLAKGKRVEAKLKAIWKQRAKETREARDYQAKITEQEQLVEIARGQMENADKRDDQPAFDTAKKNRGTALDALRTLIADAQKHVKTGSTYFNELEQQLNQIDGDKLDLPGETNDPEVTVEPDALTKDEQARLDEIESDIALDEVAGDKAKQATDIGKLISFREGILSEFQQQKRPNSAIKSAAEAVTAARGELESLNGSGGSDGPDPDLQAQVDQANERARVEANKSRLSEAALGVFGPAGSSGGGPQTVINMQSLVPPNRQWVEEIGRIATDGQGSQGFRSSGKTALPV